MQTAPTARNGRSRGDIARTHHAPKMRQAGDGASPRVRRARVKISKHRRGMHRLNALLTLKLVLVASQRASKYAA